MKGRTVIPDFQALMRPVLELTSDDQTHAAKELIATLADKYGLSDSERAELIPSGYARRFDNKVHWAITYLVQAGLLLRPIRAHVHITPVGREALALNPERIDMKALERYPQYLEFRQRTRKESPTVPTAADVEPTTVVDSATPPEDLMEAAVRENGAMIEGDLLRRAVALAPGEFELLVIRLLDKMGYGRQGSIKHSGQPGDHGIDGIISQDPLGLDRIYVQAKRYTEASVQRPEIQKFVGALMGAQGDRGVFITTSTFSEGAREEAERVNARIELIDGRRLAALMLQHQIGVQPTATAVLYSLDEDFFDSL